MNRASGVRKLNFNIYTRKSKLVIGRKLTHLLRRCIILKSSCINIHCGFKIFCSLYMSNFTSNYAFRSGTS